MRGRLLQERDEGWRRSDERMEPAVITPTGIEFFVTCHPGLEAVVAKELTEIGISEVRQSKAGVSFWSERAADGYRACLWLRSAIRVLVLLSRQQLDTDLSRGVRSGDSVRMLSTCICIHTLS